jgi:predicted nucleic acid-binding protein
VQLETASAQGRLVINDVVFAEFSVRYQSLDQVEEFLDAAGIAMAPIPRAALFLAGKAFAKYRGAGGIRSGVLPDFFVGAHAAVLGVPLLTRDTGRYRTYFPNVTLITPRQAD